jgi:hypothetical protein
MDHPLPSKALHHAIQSLTNLVYLTKLDAGDEGKVLQYMKQAESELIRLNELAWTLVPPHTAATAQLKTGVNTPPARTSLFDDLLHISLKVSGTQFLSHGSATEVLSLSFGFVPSRQLVLFSL